MSWSNFDGKPYNRDQLKARVEAIDLSHWRRKNGEHGKPLFVTLHNTSEPTISQWLSWSPEKRQGYIRNVRDFYENKGWRAGPHFFVPPTTDPCAFGFSDPGTAGTHCSCFNSDSFGVEMVGEFNVEPFDSGPGMIVRDNAIYLLALLHIKAKLDPDTIRFHIECKADNHDCPGKHVSKADIVSRVKDEIAFLSGSPPPPMAVERLVDFHARGKMSTFGGPKDTGVDADEGLALYTSADQMRQHLGADWVLSPSQAGAPGLARRINPDKPYVACRWDTAEYPFLRDAVVHVRNPDSGAVANARAVDWGPNTRTGRAADLSPGLARQLGLDTNDLCEVTVYEDGK